MTHICTDHSSRITLYVDKRRASYLVHQVWPACCSSASGFVITKWITTLLGNHIRYQHIHRVQECNLCSVFTILMSSLLCQRYIRRFYVCFLRHSEVCVHYTRWSMCTACFTAKHFCEHRTLASSCSVRLHLSGRWFSGSPIIRIGIGLALRVNLSRILKN